MNFGKSALKENCRLLTRTQKLANMLISSISLWTIAYYRTRIQREIYELPLAILVDYLGLLARLKIHGVDLRMPHSRAMGDKLFELRPSGEEGEACFIAL